ncbi:hypothetical protein ACIOK4_43680 [Streptomyces bottropensis]|uniref:hypothetical protein n=1 Tax=Streptomyces bottropensis TaxID=42235 RepID=UPI003801F56D
MVDSLWEYRGWSDRLSGLQEDLMANSSQRGRNLVSLYLFIDTNTLIGALHRNTAADEAARELFRLWETGWIGLARTDTMDTERFEGQDAETRAQREEEAADLPEALGPFVFDHSRFDASVFASGEDTTRVEDVFAIVFPTKVVSTARKN